jgi:hypothetical protein
MNNSPDNVNFWLERSTHRVGKPLEWKTGHKGMSVVDAKSCSRMSIMLHHCLIWYEKINHYERSGNTPKGQFKHWFISSRNETERTSKKGFSVFDEKLLLQVRGKIFENEFWLYKSFHLYVAIYGHASCENKRAGKYYLFWNRIDYSRYRRKHCTGSNPTTCTLSGGREKGTQREMQKTLVRWE